MPYLDDTGLRRAWGKIKSLYNNAVVGLLISENTLKYTRGNGTTGTVTVPYTGPKMRHAVSTEAVLIASNARGELQVTFPKAFASIPTVIATPYTSGGHATEIAVKNITKTGFTALFKNSWNYEAYFKASYIAIET